MRAIVNINTGPHIYARQEPFEINILQTKPVSHSVCCKPDSIRAGPPSINQLAAQLRPTTYVAHNMLHRGCNHDDTHTTLTFRSDIVVNTAVMRFILSHYCNRYKQMPLMLLLTLATSEVLLDPIFLQYITDKCTTSYQWTVGLLYWTLVCMHS